MIHSLRRLCWLLVRWLDNASYFFIPKYIVRGLHAKCFGSLWHHPRSLAARLRRQKICREWYRANGQSTFTALENPTSVPHFLYCITAMCRFVRTLFRSPRCQRNTAQLCKPSSLIHYNFECVSGSHFKIDCFIWEKLHCHETNCTRFALFPYFLTLHHQLCYIPLEYNSWCFASSITFLRHTSASQMPKIVI